MSELSTTLRVRPEKLMGVVDGAVEGVSRALEQEVCYGLRGLPVGGTRRSKRLADALQVRVERYVAGAEL